MFFFLIRVSLFTFSEFLIIEHKKKNDTGADCPVLSDKSYKFRVSL